MTSTVLIIEDSRTQANLIGRLFERAGFTPGFALDRSAALSELKRQPWSLLVIDVFIAGENSLDYLDAYREAAPDTPIAIMTAIRRDNPVEASQSLNAARRAKVEFILPKPFQFNDIAQICADVEKMKRPDGPDGSDAVYL